jgi:hypothetical protein
MQMLLGHPDIQDRNPSELHRHPGIVASMAEYHDTGHHRLGRHTHRTTVALRHRRQDSTFGEPQRPVGGRSG